MTREIAEPIAKEIAKSHGIVDELAINSFLTLMDFALDNPESLSKPRGKRVLPSSGTEDFYRHFADVFFKARAKILAPGEPTTIPDPMVSFILEIYFEHPKENTDRIKKEHQHSMAAENLVGALLERYIGTTLEKNGWAWCAGDFISAVDMVRKVDDGWQALQVKNRDNTENSSSSAIRAGTTIEKWFRTYSRKEETNWEAFPDEDARKTLSEEGFHAFVKDYLEEAKKASGREQA